MMQSTFIVSQPALIKSKLASQLKTLPMIKRKWPNPTDSLIQKSKQPCIQVSIMRKLQY